MRVSRQLSFNAFLLGILQPLWGLPMKTIHIVGGDQMVLLPMTAGENYGVLPGHNTAVRHLMRV